MSNHVTLVGAGFLGSIFARDFARICNANTLEVAFTAYDGDKVEIRNCFTANMYPTSQGAWKVEALKPHVNSYGMFYSGVRKKITRQNISKELADANLVVDAVDSVVTRLLIHNWGEQAGIPVLHIGISHMGMGSVEWTAPGQSYSLAQSKNVSVPDLKAPPCSLVSFVPLGHNIASLGAIAAATYLGIDVLHQFENDLSLGQMLSFDVSEANVVYAGMRKSDVKAEQVAEA